MHVSREGMGERLSVAADFTSRPCGLFSQHPHTAVRHYTRVLQHCPNKQTLCQCDRRPAECHKQNSGDRRERLRVWPG